MSAYIKPIAETAYLKIDTRQMMEVDRLMVKGYQIEMIQMMENAGRCLAITAREVFLSGDPQNKKIAVLAGKGGNGGGALVCARRLHSWGAKVEVYIDSLETMTEVSKHQKTILDRMGISVYYGVQLSDNHDKTYDLIIDGLIGYSLKGNPRGLLKSMIQWANNRPEKVLSLDTPSGLDLTSGIIHNPTVKANATLTLAMPKQGLFAEAVKPYVGKLYLGDISVPPHLYNEPSLKLTAQNMFRHSDIVRIY